MVLIVTMIILSVLAAALLPMLFTAERGQISASGAMRAYYLAEAGGRYVMPRLGEIADGEHTFKLFNGETFFKINKVSIAQFTSTGVVNEGSSLESRVTITYTLPAGGDIPDELPDGADSFWNRWNGYWWLSWLAWPNTTISLITGEYYVDNLDMANNTTLTVTGDAVIYVGGNTNIGNGVTINIASGGSLTIYADGNISIGNNFNGNWSGPPDRFILYGTSGCQTIQIGNNLEAYAAIYATNADITVGNNAEFYGALVGSTLAIGENSSVYNKFEQYFTPN